jgi:cytochrome c oxidase cbb3-type subunit 4
MDINDLRGLSTLFLMISFIGLCIWAYSSKRKTTFDEAANLPFADEEPSQRSMQEDRGND